MMQGRALREVQRTVGLILTVLSVAFFGWIVFFDGAGGNTKDAFGGIALSLLVFPFGLALYSWLDE
jgi:hypothetical protein